MLSPAAAEELILKNIAAFPAEDCPLINAQGGILRGAICADRDLPPFDRVTMDGFALRSADVAAGIREFQIEGVQAAGMSAHSLGAAPGFCVEIMTGAMLPVDADCVVPYEETTRTDGRMMLNAHAAIKAGQSVHARGSDYHAGDLIVPAGTRLTGREIAVAASCGCATVVVSQRPKIAVVSTGDELVEVDGIVAPHQIRRSNDYALRAALLAAGYPQVERFHLHDMRHELEHELWHILAEFDVVLLTGGVSKGKFDYLPKVLTELGVETVFHGVAQRPGKPFWFGIGQRQVAVFALPGNPVSAYTCLHRYVLPALAQATGLPRQLPRTVCLAEAVKFKPPLACLLPVQLTDDGCGGRTAQPRPTNTSGDFAGLLATDGFIELSAHQTEFPAGTVANFWSWV
jgi:molybdopterin molybdotransferase